MNYYTKKTKLNLTNLLCILILASSLAACGTSDKKEETSQDTATTVASTTETTSPNTGNTEVFKDFDWSTIPQSTSEIGAFPYLTAPAGFYIQDGDGSSESKTGYSHLKDFNKLIIFNGQSFYNAEGKVAKLKFRMKGEHTDWNQYGFDSSVERYLTGIGAKLLGKLKVNDAQQEFLNKDDDMTIYNHIVGDPYNEPVRFYALNHTNGKIMFQVFSNSASGEVAVVELAMFEQTIKAPTAAQMKKDIDANGKAILNINFDTDKSNLQPNGQKIVDEILALMKSNADLKIAIEGHTDNAGSAGRNKKLSADRANTILESLTSRGITASRLHRRRIWCRAPIGSERQRSQHGKKQAS